MLLIPYHIFSHLSTKMNLAGFFYCLCCICSGSTYIRPKTFIYMFFNQFLIFTYDILISFLGISTDMREINLSYMSGLQ